MKERKLNRLKNYNYSKNGCYFVTICIQDMEKIFGKVVNKKMILNKFGRFTKECWREIPNHFPFVRLDAFVIMPNHVHGILIIDNDGENIDENYIWQKKWARSLSSVIRGFKIGVSKFIRNNGKKNFRWHKSFHDHIIRNPIELNKIRSYIENNPRKYYL